MADKPETTETPPVTIRSMGATGLQHYGGIVDEEWHWRLKGRRGMRAFREMRDNETTIGASLELIEALARQVPWTVDPSDGPNGKAAAEFFTSVLEDMDTPIAETMSEILSMLWAGWSYFEQLYKVRRGPNERDKAYRSRFTDMKIGLRSLSIRSQDSLDKWEIDDDGDVLGMWQQAPPHYRRVFIPIEKGVLFRTKINKNNPEGRSLLRNGYRSYYFLKRIQEYEAIGIERELNGLPIARLPLKYFSSTASTEEKAVLAAHLRAAKKVRLNEEGGLVLPATKEKGQETGFDFGLLSTNGRRSIDTRAVIRDLQKDISVSFFTQIIFLGMDGVGTQALGEEVASVMGQVLSSMMSNIGSTLNRFVVDPLMEMNGFAPEDWPTYSPGSVSQEDLSQFAEDLAKLTDSGHVTPDNTLEAFVREKFKLPVQDEPRDDSEDLPRRGKPDDDLDPDDDDDDDDDDPKVGNGRERRQKGAGAVSGASVAVGA